MGKSIAVLGLGEFGQSLANNLALLGADVMVVDHNRELVQEFASKVTVSVYADLTDEQQLQSNVADHGGDSDKGRRRPGV